MSDTQARPPMPHINIGQRILIGPQKSSAIVCNEIPVSEDLFGKHYYVVCKSGQGVRARNGQRLGEAVLITVAWNGVNWAIKEAGFRVTEAMPWLRQYVQQLEELELESQQDILPEEEQIPSNAPTIDRSSRIFQSTMHWTF